MSRTFPIILAVSVAVVGAILWYGVSARQNHFVMLQGKVVKVRTIPLQDGATIALVDFQLSNPSQVPFEVHAIDLEMDRPRTGEKEQPPVVTGGLLSKAEINNVFTYEKRAGSRENDTLGARETVAAGQSLNRMIAARLDLPKSEVDARASLRIRIHAVGGVVADIVELRH